MLSVALYAIFSVIGLYALTATVFLLSARLEKSADGKLVLDPNSWHFKIAYPLKQEEIQKKIEELKRMNDSPHDTFYDPFNVTAQKRDISQMIGTTGLCAYFFKFFVMLYVGWPLAILLLGALTGTFNAFTVPFGYYLVPADKGLMDADDEDAFDCKPYLLPRIRGIRLLPIYLIIPALYTLWWYMYPSTALFVTVVVIIAIAVITLSVLLGGGIAKILRWFRSTETNSVSVVREWVAAKKAGFCPLVEIKLPDTQNQP